MIKKFLTTVFILVTMFFCADAQTGTWSGKLDVNGTMLTLVFHLDDENPTVDSPDQGAEGIPIQIKRSGAGKIDIRMGI